MVSRRKILASTGAVLLVGGVVGYDGKRESRLAGYGDVGYGAPAYARLLEPPADAAREPVAVRESPPTPTEQPVDGAPAVPTPGE